MQGKVEIAGVNTAKLKVLKNEETMELLRRTKAGDQEARRELIEGNLRLVLSVIQRFAGRGENADDLFQVGCVGLIKAIDNFDINQPVRFSTYGVPMIIGEIRRYLRDNSAIRVSRSMRDTAYKVLQVRDKYLAENQREPTVEQIAQELGIPREEIRVFGKSDFLCSHRGFLLQPVLAAVSPAGLAALRPSPAEVAEVFSVPLSFFRRQQPEVYRYELVPTRPDQFPYGAVGIPETYRWARGTVEVPVWFWEGHAIWGMTARIVRDLIKE